MLAHGRPRAWLFSSLWSWLMFFSQLPFDWTHLLLLMLSHSHCREIPSYQLLHPQHWDQLKHFPSLNANQHIFVITLLQASGSGDWMWSLTQDGLPVLSQMCLECNSMRAHNPTGFISAPHRCSLTQFRPRELTPSSCEYINLKWTLQIIMKVVYFPPSAKTVTRGLLKFCFDWYHRRHLVKSFS